MLISFEVPDSFVACGMTVIFKKENEQETDQMVMWSGSALRSDFENGPVNWPREEVEAAMKPAENTPVE